MVCNFVGPFAPEEILVLDDEEADLHGFIVIHSTSLGPAAGGCRFWEYPTGHAAQLDALRLAEGMTYKNALAGLPLGGGKAVLRRPAGNFDRQRLFDAFGRAVARLGGRYITAEDVGTSVDDMKTVSGGTRYVAGLPAQKGRPGGDPSPWTARGVLTSMTYAAKRHLSRPLRDCVVAVQGLGNVGHSLAVMLHDKGARLIVADVNADNVARTVAATGGTPVSPDQILTAAADIFAPCALGGVLSHATISSLGARIVCGAANNQLATSEDGARLADHGVLYAPDYVANAGGIINVAGEYFGWTKQEVVARVDATGRRLADVLEFAESQGMATNTAADHLARSKVAGEVERYRSAAG